MNPTTRIDHERFQHAVGHGFFHSGRLRLYGAGAGFEYVYDCGARKSRKLLAPAVDDYVAALGDRTIDMLVLSHLHADHVSGLDHLLMLRAVDTVVLPYLDPVERILVVAAGIAAGSGTASSVAFAADPTGWLRDRGVARVLTMTPEPPGGPVRISDSNRSIDDSRDLVLGGGAYATTSGGRYPQQGSEVLSHDVPLQVLEYGLAQWEFKFFCWRMDDLHGHLRQAVEEVFGGDLDLQDAALTKTWLREQLRSKVVRTKLIRCYERIAPKGLNWTSLCMRSAPAREPIDCRYSYRHGDRSMQLLRGRPFRHEIAWLGTGDAELSSPEVAAAFLRHFADGGHCRLASMSLSHHGSRHNYNAELLRELGPALVYATCPSSSNKHPDPAVVRNVHKWLGQPLLVVDERERNDLHERIFVTYGD